MSPEEFVLAIRTCVLDRAIKSTLETLADPPGRVPPRDVVAASKWYKTLSSEERDVLATALTDAAHGAVFGFLAVLDGVRVVEATEEKGEFRLTFLKGGVETVICPSDGMLLHDLLNVED